MFSKTKDNGTAMPEPTQPQQIRRTPPRAAAPSIISADMTVVGTVTATGDIQIDGKIEGDIVSTSLTVGEKAVVNGEVRADEVTIRGHVVGGLRARKVNLASTCHVEGDIIHNSLSVETGAFFQGNIKHSDDPLSERGAANPNAKQNANAGRDGNRQTFAQFNNAQQSGSDDDAETEAAPAPAAKNGNGASSGNGSSNGSGGNNNQNAQRNQGNNKQRGQQPNRN